MSDQKIATSGDLRNVLAETIVSVRDGSIELDNARTMVKLAAQINESLYSEIRANQVSVDAGNASVEFGKLAIG